MGSGVPALMVQELTLGKLWDVNVCVCGMGFAFCYGALRQSFPSTDVCVLNHSRNHEFCEKLNSIVLGIL